MMKASFSGCLYYCNDMYLNFRYRNFLCSAIYCR